MKSWMALIAIIPLLWCGCESASAPRMREAKDKTKDAQPSVIGKFHTVRIAHRTTGTFRCLAGDNPEGMMGPSVLIRNVEQYENLQTQLETPKGGWPKVDFAKQRLVTYARGKAVRISVSKVIEDLEKVIVYTNAKTSDERVIRGPVLVEGTYVAVVLDSTANDLSFVESFSR